MGVKITGFGHYIPEQRVTNAELSARFGVSEEWIVEKTGIMERCYAASTEATSDLIVPAARQCLAKAGVSPAAVECILVATMTPDQSCPSTAAIVQQQLGAANAWGFDLMAACSGFLYALQVGAALINAGTHRTVLVCAADKMSSIIDPQDRKTTLIFADGAGACLLQYSATENQVVDTICRLDSTCFADIVVPAGGSRLPITEKLVAEGEQYLRFVSRTISTDAVRLLRQVMLDFLGKHGLTFADLDFIIPHQANKRMLEALATDLGLPIEKFIINIEHLGNTSAATIPVAISQALQNGQLHGQETLLLASVGAGYTYAASLIHLNLSAHAHY